MIGGSIIYASLTIFLCSFAPIGENEEDQETSGEEIEEEEEWEQIFPTVASVDLGTGTMYYTNMAIGSVWKSNTGKYYVVKQHNYFDVNWTTMPMVTKLELAIWTKIMMDVDEVESYNVEIEYASPSHMFDGSAPFYEDFPFHAGFETRPDGSYVDYNWCEAFCGQYAFPIMCILDSKCRKWNRALELTE